MRAISGAIERVRLLPDGRMVCQTIDHQPPLGICGSGILDAIAEMRRADILNVNGRFDGQHPGVGRDDGGHYFHLVGAPTADGRRGIRLTQGDVSEVQLAKAAIRSGIEILLREAGINAGELRSFVVAGAFGNYIDPANAMRIGLFPRLPLERFRLVGNAAGAGAIQLLCSVKERQAAAQLVEKVTYLELTTHQTFFDVYAGELMFPE
jgi:uncharacterized 2Fe-2S/4Fe-4S cluster protein (DUF4445 family)